MQGELAPGGFGDVVERQAADARWRGRPEEARRHDAFRRERVDLRGAAAGVGAAGSMAARTASRLCSRAASRSSAGADSWRTARLYRLITSRSTSRTSSPIPHTPLLLSPTYRS